MKTTTRTTVALAEYEGKTCKDASDILDTIDKIMSDFIDESSEEDVSLTVIDKTNGPVRDRFRFTIEDIRTAQNLLEALSGQYPFEYEVQKEVY